MIRTDSSSPARDLGCLLTAALAVVLISSVVKCYVKHEQMLSFGTDDVCRVDVVFVVGWAVPPPWESRCSAVD